MVNPVTLQIFIEHRLFPGHCSRHDRGSNEQNRQNPCPQGASILETMFTTVTAVIRCWHLQRCIEKNATPYFIATLSLKRVSYNLVHPGAEFTLEISS